MPDRRDAIVAAVAAHNQANPESPLPRNAGQLLLAMFASGDVCQLSLQVLEDVTGLSLRAIQTVLRALLAAGIVAKEETGQGRHANRYRLLLTAGSGA